MTTETQAVAAARDVKMIIGGEQVDAADGQTFDVINPATGAGDRHRAARRAGGRGPGGRGRPAGVRGPEGLRRLVRRQARPDPGQKLRRPGQGQPRGAGAAREPANVGKPITSARGEAFAVGLVFEYYAGAANKLFGETIPVSAPGLDFTLREPIGVVRPDRAVELPDQHGRRGSWARRWRPATRAILKPASYTPLTAIRLGELALEAGFPAGVVNVVTGPGGSAGRGARGASGRRQDRLHRRDDHRARRSCGWPPAPSRRSASSSAARARTSSSPTPTWSGAAAEAPYAVFDNAGQDCCARSRIFVEASGPRPRRRAAAGRDGEGEGRRRRRTSRPRSAAWSASSSATG